MKKNGWKPVQLNNVKKPYIVITGARLTRKRITEIARETGKSIEELLDDCEASRARALQCVHVDPYAPLDASNSSQIFSEQLPKRWIVIPREQIAECRMRGEQEFLIEGVYETENGNKVMVPSIKSKPQKCVLSSLYLEYSIESKQSEVQTTTSQGSLLPTPTEPVNLTTQTEKKKRYTAIGAEQLIISTLKKIKKRDNKLPDKWIKNGRPRPQVIAHHIIQNKLSLQIPHKARGLSERNIQRIVRQPEITSLILDLHNSI